MAEQTSSYSTPPTTAPDVFPSHNIDPRLKNYDWIMQYCRAAWSYGRSYIPSTMMYYGRQRMAEIREYGLGKQSIQKYKKILLGDEVTDKTSFNVDWNPVSFLTKFREIAISKIIQREYDIEAYAVDELAKSEEDDFYNQMKIKIMMREAAQKAGSSLADSPVLKMNAGEAADEEQLKIQMQYGYKHQKAIESELGISLVWGLNNLPELRKRVIENLFDFGIGGYKEWIDDNGLICMREIRPENLVTSYCLKNNFSDSVHFGEVQFLSVADLTPYFDEKQLDFICKNVAGKWGNPGAYPIINVPGRTWDKFKVAVLDMEFQSWNTTVYEKFNDKRGNFRMNKTDFSNYGRDDYITNFRGEAEPKYADSTIEVWYKGKWLIDTGMMYDYGLCPNMKRKKSTYWKTSPSFHLYAWNFYNMTFSGITERLMPIEDNLCLTWYKLQNLKNKLIPYLIKLDVNALEGVNFGKGGKKMTPLDLVDFMLQEFVVLYRSSDLLSKNPNYDPARIEATGQLAAFKMLYEEFQALLQMMRDISGLNEITDGSTPNAKNLVPTTAAAIESTNNALYLIMNADKELLKSVSDAIVQRIQIAVQQGKVEGYAKALGSDTVKFYQISPEIANYELGIFIRDAINKQEREQFYSDLNLKDSQGLVNPADKIIVMSCNNLKQAAELLAYNIQRRQEEQHQRQMELVQQQAQGNQQVAQATEQMKQQTIQVQLQADLIRIQTEMEWQYRIEAMKKQSDFAGESVQAEARTIGHEIQAKAKVEAAHVAAGSHLVGKSIDAEAGKEIQHIANKKPKSSAA